MYLYYASLNVIKFTFIVYVVVSLFSYPLIYLMPFTKFTGNIQIYAAISYLYYMTHILWMFWLIREDGSEVVFVKPHSKIEENGRERKWIGLVVFLISALFPLYKIFASDVTHYDVLMMHCMYLLGFYFSVDAVALSFGKLKARG